MKRNLAALLLVVVLIFSFTYAGAEKSLDEITQEYKQLMDQWNRIEEIKKIFENGLPIYPEKSYEDVYAFDAYTVVPVIENDEEEQEYLGVPFLITGKLLDIKGYGIDFELDDGRKAIINFDGYDFEKKEMIDFGMYPTSKGKRFNIYCTFSGFGYELLDPNTYHFFASVTEDAKRLALQRKK